MEKEQLFYKLRHIPTGKFYQPGKGYKKNSLSPRGRVYHIKPSYSYVRHGIHVLVKHGKHTESEFVKTHEADWEIVTLKLVEVKQ